MNNCAAAMVLAAGLDGITQGLDAGDLATPSTILLLVGVVFPIVCLILGWLVGWTS